MRIATDRYYAKAIASGDISMCEYWPDDSDNDLDPIDLDLVQEMGGLDALHRARSGTR